MNNPARTLMVGLGARGKKWARIMHEEQKSQTVGYVDLDDNNLEWAQTMYEADPKICYNDMGQALKELQPDFVVLATPPMDRYENVVKVFESGAHLLSEKPLSLDFEEGIRMVKAAEEAKLGFRRRPQLPLAALHPQGPRDPPQPQDRRASLRRLLLLAQPGRLRPLPQPLSLSPCASPCSTSRSSTTSTPSASSTTPRSSASPAAAPTRPGACTATTRPPSPSSTWTAGLQVNYFGTWSGQTKLDQFLWRTDCDDGALFQYELFKDLRIIRGSENDVMEEDPPS